MSPNVQIPFRDKQESGVFVERLTYVTSFLRQTTFLLRGSRQ
ncbi:hypothetical protein HM1_1547 [Heliomicrobium modesticaldum Ice1]|uniref:Uncharacterized protein n=1 Tax=Heliobacterium modesticaldum (strain ATCC 51547 / Ice1) TaxID=498761 RepID=B0TD78_HELMI|nr:hypothetical protein HM1_1547 [Heliomicrobium modesticaldum Ice1]